MTTLKRAAILMVILMVSGKLFGQAPATGINVFLPFNNSLSDTSSLNLPLKKSSNVSYVDDRFGNSNAAIYVNGNGYVEYNNTSQLDFSGTKELTVGMWYRAEPNGAGYHNMLGFDANCADMTFSFQIRNDSNAFFGTHGAGAVENNGCWHNYHDSLARLNKWTFLVATLKGNEFKYYRDGVQIISRSLDTVHYKFFNSHLMLGAWQSRNSSVKGSYYTGAIDDVFIMNKALSAQEILNRYNGPLTSTVTINKNALRVYPNPTKGDFQLESNELIQQVEIRNTLGQIVKIVNPSASVFSFSNHNLRKGSYLLTARMESNVVVQKLIVK